MDKELTYEISRKDIQLLTLIMKLGNPYKFEAGMKVRATFLKPPFWFYGKVSIVSPVTKYIGISLEKVPPNYLFLESSLLSFSTKESWIEPYDY